MRILLIIVALLAAGYTAVWHMAADTLEANIRSLNGDIWQADHVEVAGFPLAFNVQIPKATLSMPRDENAPDILAKPQLTLYNTRADIPAFSDHVTWHAESMDFHSYSGEVAHCATKDMPPMAITFVQSNIALLQTIFEDAPSEDADNPLTPEAEYMLRNLRRIIQPAYTASCATKEDMVELYQFSGNMDFVINQLDPTKGILDTRWQAASSMTPSEAYFTYQERQYAALVDGLLTKNPELGAFLKKTTSFMMEMQRAAGTQEFKLDAHYKGGLPDKINEHGGVLQLHQVALKDNVGLTEHKGALTIGTDESITGNYELSVENYKYVVHNLTALLTSIMASPELIGQIDDPEKQAEIASLASRMSTIIPMAQQQLYQFFGADALNAEQGTTLVIKAEKQSDGTEPTINGQPVSAVMQHAMGSFMPVMMAYKQMADPQEAPSPATVPQTGTAPATGVAQPAVPDTTIAPDGATPPAAATQQ